ncbi:hypothetical protein BN2537_4049 [Streptomyces venezuelae]|nr:hypothetical protein BN2537_4049 [Streptomyces venezuelae]
MSESIRSVRVEITPAHHPTRQAPLSHHSQSGIVMLVGRGNYFVIRAMSARWS